MEGKKLYYLLESNGDLSITCPNDFEVIKTLIESDMEGFTKEEQSECYYTITPVFYTDEEYSNLPEAE